MNEEASLANELHNDSQTQQSTLLGNMNHTPQSQTPTSFESTTKATATDDESNGFVIINKKQQQQQSGAQPESTNKAPNKTEKQIKKAMPSNTNNKPVSIENKSESTSHNRSKKETIFLNVLIYILTLIQTNIIIKVNTFHNDEETSSQMYDSSLGIVLNVDQLDRDTGENKYKRRPLFEWLSRWLK
jgi:hypothetical protein